MIYTNAKVSPAGTVNKQDLVTVGKNALLFLAPVLVVVIPSIMSVIPADYKYAAVVLYILNVLLDILRKFKEGK